MKFWLFISVLFASSVGVGLSIGDPLSAKISENVSELRRGTAVMFSEQQDYYAMTALDELKVKIETNSVEPVIEFNEKAGVLAYIEELLARKPQTPKCADGMDLLSVRYEKTKKNEENTTAENAKIWISYVRINYCYRTIYKDDVENLSLDWLIANYPDLTTSN